MIRNLGAYIPNCVTYDPAQIKTISDVAYLLQHEIDLAVEGQDGALDDPIDVSRVARALKRVKAAQQDSTNMEAK